ncbi:MAG TPA: CinA family nicotinamide mononucleotide deamidase-related protein [Oligoflexia bacterium]|nr:CinA family nicotinamide mononucleotide deamidase-related protein [Oligoflexia bacterium]HMR24490.1 CinA family nicotinamide mononucleotide deamidase-related protein [Oligoflexia bacterium]
MKTVSWSKKRGEIPASIKTVEIIVIGNELLEGRNIDSNSAWLGRQLNALGYEVVHKQTVSDNMDAIVSALHLAFQRANYVLTSGGLGPTSDDLTFAAVAKSLELDLLYNKAVEDAIKQRFIQLGRPYAPANKQQAMLPQGAKVLSNALGTAPGIQFEYRHHDMQGHGFCLPGVPKEMQAIFLQHIVPQLEQAGLGQGKPRQEKIFTLSGVSESAFTYKVDALFEQDNLHSKVINIAYTASYPKLDVTLSAYLGRESFKQDIVQRFLNEFGSYIVAEDGKGIEDELVDIFKHNNLKLSFAESCTGGLLTATLLNAAGASAVLEESLICYSNDCKNKKLNVSKSVLEEYGAVSNQCAIAMAKGQIQNSQSDIAVAVTGIAGPGGGTEEKPVGLVYIALMVSENVKKKFGIDFEDTHWVREFKFKGDRQKNRQGAVMEALKLAKELANYLKLKP